jgi:hypothetical protein
MGMRNDREWISTSFLYAAARWLNCHIVYEAPENPRSSSTTYSWIHCSPDTPSNFAPWLENDERPTLLLRLRNWHFKCVKQIAVRIFFELLCLFYLM